MGVGNHHRADCVAERGRSSRRDRTSTTAGSASGDVRETVKSSTYGRTAGKAVMVVVERSTTPRDALYRTVHSTPLASPPLSIRHKTLVVSLSPGQAVLTCGGATTDLYCTTGACSM